jgi:hypothetical protein
MCYRLAVNQIGGKNIRWSDPKDRARKKLRPSKHMFGRYGMLSHASFICAAIALTFPFLEGKNKVTPLLHA